MFQSRRKIKKSTILLIQSLGVILFNLLNTTVSWAYPSFPTDPGACGDPNLPCQYDKNAVAQPQNTTMRAMALPNRLTEGDFNTYVNPGQVVNYGTAYLEGWTGAPLAWGGAGIPLPGNQKIAIFLRRPLNQNSALGSVKSMFDTTAFKLPNTTLPNGGAGGIANNGEVNGDAFGILSTAKGFGNLDLFYGIPLGNVNVGLRLSYANVSKAAEETTATSDKKFSSSSYDVSVGLGAQIKNFFGGYLDAAVSSGYVKTSVKYDNMVTAGSEYMYITSKTPLILGGLLRYVLPVGENKLLLAANMDTWNLPLELRGQNTAGSSTHAIDASTKAMLLNLDAAYHQTFTEAKLKIIYSAGVGYARNTYAMSTAINPSSAADIFGNTLVDNKDELINTFIPLGLAAEHQTFENLKTRIGIRKNVVSVKSRTQKVGTTTTTYDTQFSNDDELTMAMGLGWMPAQKVSFDFAMSANAFNLTTFFSAISIRYYY